MKMMIDKIVPHPKNSEIYNLSNIEDLSNSISEMGLLEKIVIDQKNQIISGHRRLEAVKRLGWRKIDVEKIKVSESDEIKYLIHHNKQRIKTCRELLNEVKVLTTQYLIGQGKRSDLVDYVSTTSVSPNQSRTRDIVSEMVGISGGQIARLLFIDKENPEFIDLIDKGILTINQAYLETSRKKKEKDSRIMKLDEPLSSNEYRTFYKCSSNMNDLNDGEVNLIFTSPPYWNKRRYIDSDCLGNETSPGQYVENLINHLSDCYRVLHSTGSFFLNLGDTFNNGNLLNIPHKVVIGLQDNNWILRNTIIWSKTNPKPSSTKTNLSPTYEFIFHLVKNSEYKYHPTLTPLKEDTKPSQPPRHRNVNGSKTSSTPYIPRDGKNMGDWWSEEVVRTAVVNQKVGNGLEHPAPFPEDIITLPVLQTTNEGDLVLDPFMGSGTTGRVSNRLNRNFVGYDIKSY